MYKRIFITGGASGLGKCIAQRYAQEGWSICVGDINDEAGAEVVESLKQQGVDAFYVNCDVTSEQSLIDAASAIEERWHGIDIVVNNAGVASAGRIEDASLEDWEWVLNINLLGVVRGCKTFTPIFKKQRSGHFINIASMAGIVHPPIMSSYCASKAAVVALSESMQLELRNFDVDVSVVCPSFFRTNLNNSMRSSHEGADKMIDKLFERSPITAEDIADYIYVEQQKKKFRILPHAEGRQAYLLKRVVPEKQYLKVMYQQTKKMQG